MDRRVELVKVQGLIRASRQVVIDFCHDTWGSRVNGQFKVQNFPDHWPNVLYSLQISKCDKKHRLPQLDLLASIAKYLQELTMRFEADPLGSVEHSELLSKYINHYLRQLGVLQKASRSKMVTFTVRGKEVPVKGLLGKKKGSSLAKKIRKQIVDGFDANLLTTEAKNYGESILIALRGSVDIDIQQLRRIPRCCAFKGGGMMGLAYIGSIRALYRLNLLSHIHAVSGTSAGALLATALAFGMNDVQIEQILLGFTPENILRPITKKKPLRVLRLMHNFVSKTSLFKDDKLRRYLSNIVHNATGIEHITFLQLHELVQEQNNRTGSENLQFCFRDLVIIGTDATNRTRLEFSWRTHPNMRIDDALRISVNIPGYFPAVNALLNKEGHFILREDGSLASEKTADDQQEVRLYDGGVTLNYPLYVWDSDFERQDVFGFYLENDYKANHRLPYVALGQRVLYTMMKASERPNDLHRTVMIPSTKGLKATTWKFKNSTMQKAELQGYLSTMNFFKERVRRAQKIPPTAIEHSSHAHYISCYLLLLEKYCKYSSQIFMDINTGSQSCAVQLLFHANHKDVAHIMAESYYMLRFMVGDFYFGSCQSGFLITCSLKTQLIIDKHIEWINVNNLNQVAQPLSFNDLVAEYLNFEALDKNRMRL